MYNMHACIPSYILFFFYVVCIFLSQMLKNFVAHYKPAVICDTKFFSSWGQVGRDFEQIWLSFAQLNLPETTYRRRQQQLILEDVLRYRISNPRPTSYFLSIVYANTFLHFNLYQNNTT